MHKNTPEYSKFQNFILWLTTPIFMLFITLFIPDNYNTIEVLVFLIGIPLVGIIVFSTAINFSFLYKVSAWKIIVRTTTVILLVPTTMTLVYYNHLNNYLTTIPSNNRGTFCISIDIEKTNEFGSIGNEWSYKHTINDTLFRNGDNVEINIQHPFTITSIIIEHDAINDVGIETSNQLSLGKTGRYNDELTVVNDVKVIECGGRKNSGAYAIFTVKYTINRVLPENLGFFDVYFFTRNQTETILLWCVLLLGICSIAYIVFVIYAGKKQKLYIELQKKKKKNENYKTKRAPSLLT